MIDNQTTGNLTYIHDGRGGTIYFKNEDTQFDMWYELAMPPAIVIIGIPEPKFWEAQTKISLSKRTETLRMIGDQVVNDKLSGNGYSYFDDNILSICRGKDPDARTN
jgi:hypothetical protein